MKTYTVNELAKLMDVSPSTVRNLTLEGMIEFHRTPRGHRRFNEVNVVLFLKKNGYFYLLDGDRIKAT